MSERERAVFKVRIKGSLDQVWREITKTGEPQQALFNSRMHTRGLVPGARICMRTPSGRYTSVVGDVIEVEPEHKLSHTFRFTSYDDPECRVTYELREVGEEVEFTLTCEDMPAGTKTAKQMKQGGTMIVNTLKSVVETGKPPLGTRLLHLLFKVMEPLTPKRARSENWPLEAA